MSPSTALVTPGVIKAWLDELRARKGDWVDRDHKVFVTMGAYTEEAEAYAESQGVELLDGGNLIDMAVEVEASELLR